MKATDEIRKRCRNAIRNTATGNYLGQAIDRVDELEAENERLRGNVQEWLEKTEWVQERVFCIAGEHRADAARKEVERLREALLFINNQLPINSTLKPHVAAALKTEGE